MPRSLILAVGVLVLFGSAYAQQVAVRQSPAVKRILDEAEKGVRRNRKAYEEANAKTLAEAEKALQKEVDRLLDAKKAEEAVALKQVVANFKDEVIENAEADKQAKPQMSKYVGQWSNPNEKILRVINPDGSFVQYEKDGKVYLRGNWRALSESSAEVTRTNGSRFRVWAVTDSMLAVQWFLPTGAEDGDGQIWFRQ